MKKIIIIIGIIIIAFTLYYYWRHPLGARVVINGHIFSIDVAVTAQEKELGLGQRDSLAFDRGMLFVYDHTERYSYWMKGMRFPLDIIWIKDNTVMDITKNVPVPVSDVLPIYTPAAPVNKVLEVNAGAVERAGIKVGDTVHISFK